MLRSRMLGMAVTIPALAFAAIQIVPYGRDHAAPANGKLVVFDSPRTEKLARKACFDCHSNQTKWPWYASVAPMSWRIQSHVDEGREALNFTALDTSSEDGAEAAGEAGEETLEGAMPLADYRLMHPEARLTAAERQELARGLDRTFAAFAEDGRSEGEHDGQAALDPDDGNADREGDRRESEKRERDERR